MPRSFIRTGKPRKSEFSVKGKPRISESNGNAKPSLNDFTSRNWS